MQKSLRQSVKQLLEDKIESLGVGHKFRVLNDRIETPYDGVIIFQGMQNHTATTIKSLEGFDGGWFEEAQSMSAKSLGLLRPTIRKPGSELWFTWNPDQPSDPIDTFLRSPMRPPSSIVVGPLTFRDNPLFPQVLREEMEYDRRRDPDRYAHVWEGDYDKKSEARVFKNFRVENFETPPGARFMFGGDFGFSVDPTVLLRMFVEGRTLYIDREAYKVGCEVDHTPALFAGTCPFLPTDPRYWANPYGWAGVEGSRQWPLRLDSSNPQMISYLRRHGFQNAVPSIKGPNSIEEGINFLKSFDIVIHEEYCPHAVSEFSTFSYKTDKLTGEILPVLEEEKNHTIDSARYAVELLRRAANRAVVTTYGSGR